MERTHFQSSLAHAYRLDEVDQLAAAIFLSLFITTNFQLGLLRTSVWERSL